MLTAHSSWRMFIDKYLLEKLQDQFTIKFIYIKVFKVGM